MSKSSSRKGTIMKILEVLGSIADTIFKIAFIALAVTYIYKGAILAYDYGFRVFTEPAITTGDGRIISVEIKESDDAKSIGEMLESKGLIRDAKIFFLQERLSENHGKEVPGIYDLSTSMTGQEMLEVICPEQTEEPEQETVSPAIQELMNANAEAEATVEEANAEELSEPIAEDLGQEGE